MAAWATLRSAPILLPGRGRPLDGAHAALAEGLDRRPASSGRPTVGDVVVLSAPAAPGGAADRRSRGGARPMRQGTRVLATRRTPPHGLPPLRSRSRRSWAGSSGVRPWRTSRPAAPVRSSRRPPPRMPSITAGAESEAQPRESRSIGAASGGAATGSGAVCRQGHRESATVTAQRLVGVGRSDASWWMTEQEARSTSRIATRPSSSSSAGVHREAGHADSWRNHDRDRSGRRLQPEGRAGDDHAASCAVARECDHVAGADASPSRRRPSPAAVPGRERLVAPRARRRARALRLVRLVTHTRKPA